MASIVIERGNEKGKRIQIDKFPFSIGRDLENDLALDDEEVSREHMRIKRRGNLYILEDFGSRNGTYVNGDRVVNTTLTNGDKILLGTTELKFLAAHADIHIIHEFSDLGKQEKFHEVMGFSGSFSLNGTDISDGLAPTRFDLNHSLNKFSLGARRRKVIDEIVRDVMVMETLSEAGRVLLRSCSKWFNRLNNAALFVWKDTTRKLAPTSHWQKDTQASFKINTQSLRDAITRKQGLHIPTENEKTSLVVVPLLYHGSTLAVIHFERETIEEPSKEELTLLAHLCHRIAPIFETLILRSEMDTWLVGMVETIIAMVEAKDTYTRGHSERVARYAIAIADELRINKETKKMLMVSSLCHDIGKVGVPDAILKKASILSADEYQEMKLHPELGEEIVRHMPNYRRFVSGVKYHHEKWDGTGYPEGLIGEEIPFFGRIIGLADVFDAMVSGRAYSGFLDQTDAIEKLHKEQDLFDPEIFKAFVKAYESGRLTVKTSTLSGERPEKTGAPEKQGQEEKSEKSEKSERSEKPEIAKKEESKTTQKK